MNALKEQKKTLRELLDEKERDLNNRLTNKEIRKKLSIEIQDEKQKERIKIASPLIDMMKTFRFVGNKKKPLWQYSDSIEMRSMLNDVKYNPNDLFWTSIKNQIVFYYQKNVIGDNTKELNEKLDCFEKLKENFNSDLLVIEKNTETKMEEVKKKYK